MIKFGILMDPISKIDIYKDSSFAILLEIQRRKYEIYYMEMNSIYMRKGKAFGHVKLISVKQDETNWYSFHEEKNIQLSELDVILMRKDPPFNMEFIYATYILEKVEEEGVLIINDPKSLRSYNEKFFISYFSDYAPDTLISSCKKKFFSFWKEHGDIILKPLDKMGGRSVFYIKKNDSNFSVIVENLTKYGSKFCMAQKYIADVKNGDKRVFLIDGMVIPYCLVRVPKSNEHRSNLLVGGIGEVKKLNKNDLNIVKRIANNIKKRKLILVGLDIIGNYLTEINITSPTCIQEIERFSNVSITKKLIDVIEKYLLEKSE